ncbi:MAG: SIS domain-containing protein [Clostridia bacterium]|nr:SIS domain-containing protein [Clostridia bacterium]
MKAKQLIENLILRYPVLGPCRESVERSYKIMEDSFSKGKKLLIAGNGGSCSDANHIVGEMMKGFCLPRPCSKVFEARLMSVDSIRGAELAQKLQRALPSIALDNHSAMSTAFMNDVENGGALVYAQQLYGYGVDGDVFLGISTSGNAQNVVNAAVVAKALGMKVLGMTGCSGGSLLQISDVCICVPEQETYKVQELHLPVYHTLCLMLENHFFGEA